jgi:hypothetical protein
MLTVLIFVMIIAYPILRYKREEKRKENKEDE